MRGLIGLLINDSLQTSVQHQIGTTLAGEKDPSLTSSATLSASSRNKSRGAEEGDDVERELFCCKLKNTFVRG